MAAALRKLGERSLGLAPRVAHVRPFALNLSPFKGSSDVPSEYVTPIASALTSNALCFTLSEACSEL